MDTQIFSSVLESRSSLTGDVFQFRFTRPENFSYLAGQFVQFLIPDNGKTVLRSYSLCSAPSDPFLEYCIKILPDGKASQHLDKMKIGETLQFQGPRGRFVHDNGQIPLYFVATGTGIAPILGIIRDELENKKNTQPIRLLFGIHDEEDIFWNDRFEDLKQNHSLFDYQITLSQPKPNGGWSGLRGRVTEHILKNLQDCKYFLCGNAAMVKDVRENLLQNGIKPDKIHFEIF